jgi:hypothetical protein
MKKLSTAIIFTLFATTVPALATANQAYTCDSATKVVRDYKGNPQAWKNRGLYERSRQATVYIQTHCSGASVNNASQQTAKVRPANSKDFYNAGYRKGVIAGQIAARRASSVTNPMVAPVRTVYVTHKPKASAVSQKTHSHKGHNHHSAADRMDCARTDALNRQAGPISTFISKTVTPTAQSKVHHITKAPMIRHGDHSHHTEAGRLDCELTDSLNRQAGPVTTVISRSVSPVAHSKVHSFSKAPMIQHGNHSHHTEAGKADCALTDALNRRSGPVVSMLKRTR